MAPRENKKQSPTLNVVFCASSAFSFALAAISFAALTRPASVLACLRFSSSSSCFRRSARSASTARCRARLAALAFATLRAMNPRATALILVLAANCLAFFLRKRACHLSA